MMSIFLETKDYLYLLSHLQSALCVEVGQPTIWVRQLKRWLIPPFGNEFCSKSLIVVETTVTLRDRPATISSGSLLSHLTSSLFRPLQYLHFQRNAFKGTRSLTFFFFFHPQRDLSITIVSGAKGWEMEPVFCTLARRVPCEALCLCYLA